ncbi:GGDEF domain-containing protein [Paenibacillus lemnae]|uniref:GGDEF domain-containing protein n=1 Tax=Paenibacillus lemnae TaxID=1330551 RepID=A0A848M4W8_PAELE|nr:GGDEF domain-containing protein [Paenibacillus lemnae]NMO95152.1 GGDEF domain-containing protein [Paenibacillus lemnae]
MNTVFICLVVGQLFTVLLLCAYRNGHNRDRAVNSFYAAKILQAAGWLLAMFRNDLPDGLTVYAANTLLFLGAALEASAFLQITGAFGRKTARFYMGLTLVCAFVFCMVAFMTGSERYRIVAASLGMALFFVLPAVKMLGVKPGSLLMKMTGYMNVLISAGTWIRGIVAWTTSDSASLYEPGVFQSLSFMLLFLLMFMGNVGFVLLSKERSDRELLRLASYDDLTGVRNRRTFILEAKRTLALCRRKRVPVSFMLMDIDDFKDINDTYGHDRGDLVLQEYAAIVQRCLREGDLLGRYGGDEFAVLLSGSDAEASDFSAEAIRRAAEEACVESSIRFTLSIGVVTVEPDHMLSVDKLYKLSDNALYQAKQQGRNRATRSVPDSSWPTSSAAG